VAELARHISAFLQSEAVTVIPDRPSRVSPVLAKCRNLEDHLLSQERTRRLLIVLFLLYGLAALFVFILLIGLVAGTGNTVTTILAEVVLERPNVNSPTTLTWFLVMTVLDFTTGFLLLMSALAFLRKWDNAAVTLGLLAMVISLTFINTLSFYFNQFSILLNSIFAFLVLLALLRYRNRFLSPKSDSI
jgi:hypothetical protein